jgi:hypothetical protein
LHSASPAASESWLSNVVVATRLLYSGVAWVSQHFRESEFDASAKLPVASVFSVSHSWHPRSVTIVWSETVNASRSLAGTVVFDASLPFDRAGTEIRLSLLAASALRRSDAHGPTAVFSCSQPFSPTAGLTATRGLVGTSEEGLDPSAGGASSLGLALGLGLGILALIVAVAVLVSIMFRRRTAGNERESDDDDTTPSEEATNEMNRPHEMEIIEDMAPAQTEVATFSDVLTFCDEPELGDDLSEGQPDLV